MLPVEHGFKKVVILCKGLGTLLIAAGRIFANVERIIHCFLQIRHCFGFFGQRMQKFGSIKIPTACTKGGPHSTFNAVNHPVEIGFRFLIPSEFIIHLSHISQGQHGHRIQLSLCVSANFQGLFVILKRFFQQTLIVIGGTEIIKVGRDTGMIGTQAVFADLEAPFKNFNFTFEYKVARGSNSGIFFYVKEVPAEEGPYYITAPEYQILDNANHLDATQGVDGNRQSASLYDMIPAKPQNAKPFGEWNTGEIRVFKGTVIHYQNGEKVAEYHLWTPEWNKLIDNSKFSSTQTTWPTAYKHLTELGLDAAGNVVGGYILLQDHGDDVWFRNLKVEVID